MFFFLVSLLRGRFRLVQHVRPNRDPTKRAPTKRGPYKRTGTFLLRRVMLTTLSLGVSCEFSRAVKSIISDERKRSSVFGGKKMGGNIAELDDDNDD